MVLIDRKKLGKHLVVSTFFRTFAVSINDKGKGNTLEYSFQHI